MHLYGMDMIETESAKVVRCILRCTNTCIVASWSLQPFFCFQKAWDEIAILNVNGCRSVPFPTPLLPPIRRHTQLLRAHAHIQIVEDKVTETSNKSIREEEGLSEDSDLARNPRSNLDLNFKSDTQDGLL